MTSKDEQARLADLLDLAARGGAEEMDPNDVAALAAGQPGQAARSALEARLQEAPPEDRHLVADTAAAASAREGAHARRGPWRLLGAAALVLLAIGAAWTLTGPGGPPAVLQDSALATAFASLHDEAPDTFEGIEPLLAGERAGGLAPALRGGIRVHAPAGALLRVGHTLRWQAVAGASSYSVRVLSDEGYEVLHLTHTGTSLAWPPAVVLEQGTAYVVAVSTVAAGIRTRGSAAFRLLSAEEKARYETALGVIAGAQPVALRPVLRAHLAIRQGLLVQARLHLDQAGDDAVTRMLLTQTRAYLDRVQGRE